MSEQDQNKKEHHPLRKKVLFGVLWFLVGAGATFAFVSLTSVKLEGVKPIREGAFTFINPLLECDTAQELLSRDNYNFKQRLSNLAYAETASGTVNDMAIYYRDLTNGPWFGINATDPFIPASLLKVPIMMVFFKAAETDPGILNETVRYAEPAGYMAPGGKQLVPPSQEIQLGKEYTVIQLIEAAIERSDNQALLLLTTKIPAGALAQLYLDLGVPEDVLLGREYSLSVKQYATFFRILFNASYLGRGYSEKALKLLSHVEYRNGLVAGVPSEVTVAHKFGESGTTEEHQLHDCGIVYYPLKPYLLCVMTKGKNLSGLESAIRDVSSFVYQEVSKLP